AAAAGRLRQKKTALKAVFSCAGAGNRNRTYDLRITNAPLYQLSYSGVAAHCRGRPAPGSKDQAPTISRPVRRRSARRIASATIVKVGNAQPLVGKTELPATCRFSMPWTLQCGSTTP